MQQLIAARGLIDNPDNGYVADVMLANPAERDKLARRIELLKLLTGSLNPSSPRAPTAVVAILGLDMFVSNRVPAGTVYIARAGWSVAFRTRPRCAPR